MTPKQVLGKGYKAGLARLRFASGEDPPEGAITRAAKAAMGDFEMLPRPGFLGLHRALSVVEAIALTDGRSHRNEQDFLKIVLPTFSTPRIQHPEEK